METAVNEKPIYMKEMDPSTTYFIDIVKNPSPELIRDAYNAYLMAFGDSSENNGWNEFVRCKKCNKNYPYTIYSPIEKGEKDLLGIFERNKDTRCECGGELSIYHTFESFSNEIRNLREKNGIFLVSIKNNSITGFISGHLTNDAHDIWMQHEEEYVDKPELKKEFLRKLAIDMVGPVLFIKEIASLNNERGLSKLQELFRHFIKELDVGKLPDIAIFWTSTESLTYNIVKNMDAQILFKNGTYRIISSFTIERLLYLLSLGPKEIVKYFLRNMREEKNN
jgi:hypothetical protein